MRSVFLRLHARFSVSLVCVGDPDTSVFHEVLSEDSQSKVFNVETSQLEGIQCHEWYSGLLKVRSSFCWCRLYFPCYRPGWKYGILAVCFADLTNQ